MMCFQLTFLETLAARYPGTTVLLNKSTMEKNGGNQYVYKHTSKDYPQSAEILAKLNSSVTDLRASRNKIAHQEGYSNKNLIIIQAMENFSESDSSEITKVMSLEDIKAMVRDDISCNFKPILPVMNDLVTDLVNSFSFVYSELVKNT